MTNSQSLQWPFRVTFFQLLAQTVFRTQGTLRASEKQRTHWEVKKRTSPVK
jgi:hypothetical protein